MRRETILEIQQLFSYDGKINEIDAGRFCLVFPRPSEGKHCGVLELSVRVEIARFSH